MKKTSLLLGLSMLAGLTLAGCNINQDKDDSAIKVRGVKDTHIKALARQTIIGFAGLNTQPTTATLATFTDSEIADIKETLAKVDILLSKDSSSIVVDTQTSDKEGYLNKLSMSYNDQSITLYYNDISERVEHDEDEVETIKKFEGIALYGSKEYNFTFVNKEEKEIGEVEKETSLKLYTDLENYILVSQNEEQELNSSEVGYEYKEVVSGRTVVDYEFSIETSLSKKSVDLELNSIEYELEYITHNGEEVIKVELENDKTDSETRGLFKKVTTGETITYELIK